MIDRAPKLGFGHVGPPIRVGSDVTTRVLVVDGVVKEREASGAQHAADLVQVTKDALTLEVDHRVVGHDGGQGCIRDLRKVAPGLA